MPSPPSPPLLLLTAVCASLAFLLYNKRNKHSLDSSSSPSPHTKSTTTNAQTRTSKQTTTNGKVIEYSKEPDYFPFTEAIAGKVRMGVKRMAEDAWIEIGPSFPLHLSLKKEILRDHRDLVWVSRDAPSTLAAKREVLDELVKYLPVQFPDIFQLKDGFIHNHVTGDKWKVEGNLEMDPLEIASLLVQEDLVILEQEDDKLLLTAGCVCFPSRWNVKEKFMMNLPHVHTPVPPFEKHLANPVMRALLDLKPGFPIWRANWSIMDDLESADDLYLPHARTNLARVITKVEEVGEKMMYRVERQTLSRLPQSNAVLFTIRTYQRPLNEVVKHKEVIPKLISAIKEMEPTMAPYKSRDLWMDVCIEYLEKQLNISQP